MRLLTFLGLGLLGLGQMWALLAILLGGGHGGPGPLRISLAVVYVACLFAALRWAPRITGVGTAVALLVLVIGWYSTLHPSHDRAWSEDQSKLPHPEIHGDILTVANLRDFRYRSESDWDARWVDATYDLRELVGSWYVVEHFSEFEGAAHAMATFEFSDGRFLAVSVEIRKEPGEGYHPLFGAFRQYELMYVFADERDALQLRTNHRPDSDVYLYEVDAEPATSRRFLEHAVERAARLASEPTFYNTFNDTCASNLASLLNQTSGVGVAPWDVRMLLPGYSHELAWTLDLLGEAPLATLKEQARVRNRAEAARDSEQYSLIIRGRQP